MATWPATLPTPEFAGFKVTPADQIIRTSITGGLPRYRRRTSARNDSVSVMWHLSDSQLSTFRTWFDEELSGGAEWFTVALPYGYYGLVETSARFADTFSIDAVGYNLWAITASLELRN